MHHALTAADDLAGLTVLYDFGAGFLIYDEVFNVGIDNAYGADLAMVMAVDGYRIDGLGHTVALGDHGAGKLFNAFYYVNRQRSRAAGYDLQRAYIVFLIFLVGSYEFHPQRNAGPNGRTVFFDHPKYLVQAFGKEYRAAHSQVDHNALAEAECVGHSKRDYDHVVFIVIVVKEGSEILHLSHRLGDERVVCLAAAL